MKKVLLSVAALALGLAANAALDSAAVVTKMVGMGVDTALVNSGVIPKGLNFEANQYWATQNFKGPKTYALEVIDTSKANFGKWFNNGTNYVGQYTIAAETDGTISVALKNLFQDATGTANYADFNIKWGTFDATGKGANPTNPFGYTVAGTTAATTVYTAKESTDTIHSVFVALPTYDAVVTVVAKADVKTNLRVDLIDANGRIANGLAPHHYIAAGNTYQTLEFRWDYTGDDLANPNFAYEKPGTGEFNIGMAVDGYAGNWWGQGNRYSATTPMLFNLQGYAKGGVALGLGRIVGLALTLDDGTYGAKGDIKKVTFKSIVVGNAAKSTAVTNLKDYSSVVATRKDNGKSLSERVKTDVKEEGNASEIVFGSNVGRTFKTVEGAVLVDVTGQVIAKEANGEISTAAAEGLYYVVSSKGTAKVSVK